MQLMKNFLQPLIFFIGIFLFLISSPGLAKEKTKKELQKEIQDLSERVSQLEEDKTDSPGAKSSEKNMRTLWNDGVRFVYDRDDIWIRVGGKIQVDALFIDGDGPAKNAYGTFNPNGSGPHLSDGAQIRRARLYIMGLLYNHVAFKAEYDWATATGTAAFQDVYVGLTRIPILGTFLVGHTKEPIGLENLTSDNHITFMERSLPVRFLPGYNTGLVIKNHIGKRLTYALGVYRQTNGVGFGAGDNEYNITGRITGTPFYTDGGRMLVHLGGAFSYRNPTFDALRFNAPPEANLGPIILETLDPVTGLNLQSDGVQLYGAEFATVIGPFSAQAEFTTALVQVLPLQFGPPLAPFPFSGGNDSMFHSWYAFLSYFITGESRSYKSKSGTFGRVRPKKVFLDGQGGTGAIEIAARYSHLDLQDNFFNPGLGVGAGFNGTNAASYGEVDNYTLGVNWYLNPNTRVMTNYIISDPDPNGLMHLFNFRFAVDF